MEPTLSPMQRELALVASLTAVGATPDVRWHSKGKTTLFTNVNILGALNCGASRHQVAAAVQLAKTVIAHLDTPTLYTLVYRNIPSFTVGLAAPLLAMLLWKRGIR